MSNFIFIEEVVRQLTSLQQETNSILSRILLGFLDSRKKASMFTEAFTLVGYLSHQIVTLHTHCVINLNLTFDLLCSFPYWKRNWQPKYRLPLSMLPSSLGQAMNQTTFLHPNYRGVAGLKKNGQ
jgi:hypothetical protein